MKIRMGFVSNSSSSSFIVSVNKKDVDDFLLKINSMITYDHLDVIKNKKDIVQYLKSREEFYFTFVKDYYYDDEKDSIVYVPIDEKEMLKTIKSLTKEVKKEITRNEKILKENQDRFNKLNNENCTKVKAKKIKENVITATSNLLELELNYRGINKSKEYVKDIDKMLKHDIDGLFKLFNNRYDYFSKLMENENELAIITLRYQGEGPMSEIEEKLSLGNEKDFEDFMNKHKIKFNLVERY